MDNSSDKEKWVNEVLKSTEGIKKAEGNPFLYEKIMFRLYRKETIPVVSEGILLPKWIIATVFILVINSIAFIKELNHNKTTRPMDSYTGIMAELSNQITYNY